MLTALTNQEAKPLIRSTAISLTPGNRIDFNNALNNGTALSVLNAHEGPRNTIAILCALIMDCNNYFNVVRPMNAEQVADFAEDLLSDFWFCKLEEFIAFFHLCKKGKYINVLDRIDPGVYSKGFEIYMAERDNYVTKAQYDYSFEQPREARPEDAVNRTLSTVTTVKQWAKDADKRRKDLDPSR